MRLFNVIAAACLAGFAGMCGEASAKVKLPALFSDGMVMQQGGKAPIWGESDKKNGNVTVKTEPRMPSARLRAVMSPPWSFTNLYVRLRPMPKPNCPEAVREDTW
mgnify:CR=1 FL=1